MLTNATAQSRIEWVQARARLGAALTAQGWPDVLAEPLARQLGSPKAIERMAAWVRLARPASLEMIVDEALAICAVIDAWRERKAAREAQAAYSEWLRSETRMELLQDPRSFPLPLDD